MKSQIVLKSLEDLTAELIWLKDPVDLNHRIQAQLAETTREPFPVKSAGMQVKSEGTYRHWGINE